MRSQQRNLKGSCKFHSPQLIFAVFYGPIYKGRSVDVPSICNQHAQLTEKVITNLMTQMKQAQSIADAGAGSLCDATLHIGQETKFHS